MGALLGNLISFVCESNSFVISVRRLPTSYFFSSEITLSSTLGARKAYGIQWDSRNWYKSGTEDSNSLSGSLWLEETSEMIQFSSVQFSRSVVSDSMWPHESKHARPPFPSSSPGVHSNSCPLSQWCHPTTSSSVTASLPALNYSQHQDLFQWVNSSHQVARV